MLQARRARPDRPRLPRVPVPRTPAQRLGTVVAAVVVVGALVAAALLLLPRSHQNTVTAHFTRTVGLYKGSQVRILGVPVGTVRSVTPHGTSVTVVLQYDRRYDVPANAQAAVVAPSLVSDRYVQLLPAYTSGPTMRDGADIPVERTAVPVELDRITQSLDDLTRALGPEGANKDGSLSRLLATSSDNLQGQGKNLNQTVDQLSKAVGAVSGGREDLFATVKNLQSFTSTLAADDPQVRQLNSQLATVSDQLDGERDDLGAALKNLAIALTEVSSFVHDNRSILTSDVHDLTSVTGTVAKDRDQLAETLTNAPVAVSNLQNAYNPGSGTLDTRDNADQLKHPDELVCGLVNSQFSKPTQCAKVLGPVLDPLKGIVGQATQGGTPSLPTGLLSGDPRGVGGGVTVDRVGPDRTLGGILGGAR